MSWANLKANTLGPITLSACPNEGDEEYESVLETLATSDFNRLVLRCGTFSSLEILETCSKKIQTLLIQTLVNTSFSGIEKLELLTNFDSEAISKKPLPDFGKLTNLEKCFLAWDKKYDSSAGCQQLFSLINLKSLGLRYWSMPDCITIAKLRHLEELAIAQGSLNSLSGIETCSNLKSIELHYLSKLNDISHISNVGQLEKLEISNCRKIVDISPLFSMHNLRKIKIEKTGACLESLDFIARLPKLETICLDTDIGHINWNVLFNHPTLFDARFSTHKGYDVSDMDIQEFAKQSVRKVVGPHRFGPKTRPSFAFNLV